MSLLVVDCKPFYSVRLPKYDFLLVPHNTEVQMGIWLLWVVQWEEFPIVSPLLPTRPISIVASISRGVMTAFSVDMQGIFSGISLMTAPCGTAEYCPLSIESRFTTAYSIDAIAVRLPKFRDKFRIYLKSYVIHAQERNLDWFIHVNRQFPVLYLNK